MFGLRVTLSVARTISVFRDTQLNSFYVYPSEWKGRLVKISVFSFQQCSLKGGNAHNDAFLKPCFSC